MLFQAGFSVFSIVHAHQFKTVQHAAFCHVFHSGKYRNLRDAKRVESGALPRPKVGGHQGSSPDPKGAGPKKDRLGGSVPNTRVQWFLRPLSDLIFLNEHNSLKVFGSVRQMFRFNFLTNADKLLLC